MCALVTGVQTCALPISSNLSRWPLAALWLGRSAELLQNGCMAWPPGPEVGMIAGSLPHGLGGLLARFEGDNDGTVLVEETRRPPQADHVVGERSEERRVGEVGVGPSRRPWSPEH